MIALNLQVTLESTLHIGSETRLNTEAMRPMLKDADGLPYIPATTIKGRLRHEVERLLRSYTDRFVCHAPVPEQMCQAADAHDLCTVCHLFGSPWYESPLLFEDLRLVPEDVQVLAPDRNPRTQTRYSVSMNRKRRVAAHERLFTTEIFAPGLPLVFEGTAHFYGESVQLAPLLLAVRAVNTLGSGRSRGYGWCTVAMTSAEGVIDDLAHLWAEWLAT